MRRLTQPLSFSYYYYSPWQPSPFLSSRRNETPFRPGPHGLQAPTLSLSLPLLSSVPLSAPFLHRSVDTLVYSFSEPRTEAGFGYCFLGFQGGGGGGEEGTCPRPADRGPEGEGESCWFSTKSTGPGDGPHCFISHESVTRRGPHEVVKSVSSPSNHVSGVGDKGINRKYGQREKRSLFMRNF